MRPMRRWSLAASSVLIVSSSLAQVTFERTWSWHGNNTGLTVAQVADGGYVVGASASLDVRIFAPTIIRTDSLGDTLWVRHFPPEMQKGYACVTRGQQYVIVGKAYRQNTDNDVVVVSCDSLGDSLWSYEYTGPSSDMPYAITATDDGGVAVDAVLSTDTAWGVGIIKLDKSGTPQWTRIHEDLWFHWPYALLQTADRGYIFAGSSWDTLERDSVWLMKTDSLGDTLWSRFYGGTGVLAYSVRQTHDGGYILAGPGGAVLGRTAACLIRTDGSGDTLWTRYYLPDYVTTDARAVCETQDHGFAFAGQMEPASGGFPRPLWLVRTDSVGDTLWTRSFMPWFGRSAMAHWIEQTHDGGFVITGDLDAHRVYLIKTDSTGRVYSDLSEEPAHPTGPVGFSLTPNPASAGFVELRCSIVTGELSQLRPTAVRVFDVAGRHARSFAVPAVSLAGGRAYPLDLRGLSAGVYMAEVRAAGRSTNLKLVLAR